MPTKIKSKIISQRVDKGETKPKTRRKPVLQKRPDELTGSTYKRKYPGCEAALYITINDIVEIDENGKEKRTPHELLLNSKDMSHYQWTQALTRIMSAVMRQGGDCSFLAEELKNVFDPRGGIQDGHRQLPSMVADIGYAIEEHLIAAGIMQAPESIALSEEKQAIKDAGIPTSAAVCPKCSVKALVKLDGCFTCLNCGDSKCG
jgi:hypothetical protein